MSQADNLRVTRFITADNVSLVGWLAEPETNTDTAVVHVHGMSGNGFENPLLDALRASSVAGSRAIFTFNNRGAGIVTWVNNFDGNTFLGGAAYEVFEDSSFDIAGAMSAVEAAGYSKIILQGHSLGCAKVVNYLTTTHDERVIGTILLAPTDMQRWGTRTPAMLEAAAKAESMVTNGQGNDLVGDTCWDNAPISAQVFNQYVKVGGPSDIYGTKVARSLTVPTLVVYGTADVGIVEIDGSIEAWRERAVETFPEHTRMAVIEGATHGFREHLGELSDVVSTFAEELQR